MAATRLIAIHHLKGKTLKQCLNERIEYSLNSVKTENGEYVSFYECAPETVIEEFALSKREYELITGRHQQRGVIAYMIRQSFKPGEVSPKQANKIGYDLAMRFTKGKHMFFVATHTDREHVHNHIIFNSTTLDCTRKFRNFFLSGKALQKLSDLICVENSLSVIRIKTKVKDKRHEDSFSKRDIIRRDIDIALQMNPKTVDDIIKFLAEKGYIIKYGKHIAVKKKEDKRFLRLDSLGEGYTQQDLEKIIVNDVKVHRKKKGYQKKLSLLIDVQQKITEGKGGGYAHWAKVFNIKQMAQTILFLQEHEFESFEQLDIATNEVINRFHEVSEKLKYLEKQLGDYTGLKKQIINYSMTREIYVEYRKAGYSKKFLEAHKEEIQMHKEAKLFFDKLEVSKIPKVKELNEQISEVYNNRRNIMEEYYRLKEEMRKMMVVKENVRRILNDSSEEKRKEKIL